MDNAVVAILSIAERTRGREFRFLVVRKSRRSIQVVTSIGGQWCGRRCRVCHWFRLVKSWDWKFFIHFTIRFL